MVEALVEAELPEVGNTFIRLKKTTSKATIQKIPIFYKRNSLTMVQKRHVFLLIAILFTSQSCFDDQVDCATVLCAGPPSIALDILLDGENVFLNNTYSIDDVSLTGVSNSEIAYSLFVDAATENALLVLNVMSFDPESLQFTIDLGEDFSVNMVVETSLTPGGGCCSGIPILESLEIDGVDQDLATFTFTVNLN